MYKHDACVFSPLSFLPPFSWSPSWSCSRFLSVRGSFSLPVLLVGGQILRFCKVPNIFSSTILYLCSNGLPLESPAEVQTVLCAVLSNVSASSGSVWRVQPQRCFRTRWDCQRSPDVHTGCDHISQQSLLYPFSDVVTIRLLFHKLSVLPPSWYLLMNSTTAVSGPP